MSEEKSIIKVNGHGVDLRSFEDMYRFSKCIVQSHLAPRGLDTPEKVTIVLQAGAELDMPPMVALRSIAVINGAPTIYGDAALALVRRSGLLEKFDEKLEGDVANMTDDVVATCGVQRKGEDMTLMRTFSVADAKRANLWGKSGPWTTHPKRMLQYKARAFTLRDAFPDVLLGMHLTEEMVGEPIHVDSVDVTESKTQKLLDEVSEKAEDLAGDGLDDITTQPPIEQPEPEQAEADTEPTEPGDSPESEVADKVSATPCEGEGNEPASEGSDAIWVCRECDEPWGLDDVPLQGEKGSQCGGCFAKGKWRQLDLAAKAAEAKKQNGRHRKAG